VNYSQWQRERIRFTWAAGTAGEHTKGSEYEHELQKMNTITVEMRFPFHTLLNTLLKSLQDIAHGITFMRKLHLHVSG